MFNGISFTAIATSCGVCWGIPRVCLMVLVSLRLLPPVEFVGESPECV